MARRLPKETNAQRNARWRSEKLQGEYMRAADLMEEKRLAWLNALEDYRQLTRKPTP